MKVVLPALTQRRGFITDASATFTVCDLEGGGHTNLAVLWRPGQLSAEQHKSWLTNRKSQSPADTEIPFLHELWGTSPQQLCSGSFQCHSHGGLALLRLSTSLLPFGFHLLPPLLLTQGGGCQLLSLLLLLPDCLYFQ